LALLLRTWQDSASSHGLEAKYEGTKYKSTNVHYDGAHVYSARRITPSLNCITVRGEGMMKRARGCKTAESLSEHVQKNRKHFFLFNFVTIGGILIH
jgi:hypothetical protein